LATPVGYWQQSNFACPGRTSHPVSYPASSPQSKLQAEGTYLSAGEDKGVQGAIVRPSANVRLDVLICLLTPPIYNVRGSGTLEDNRLIDKGKRAADVEPQTIAWQIGKTDKRSLKTRRESRPTMVLYTPVKRDDLRDQRHQHITSVPAPIK